MLKLLRVGAGLVFVAVAVAVMLAGCGGAGSSAATPIHQTNVFFDGVSHGDYRQACSVVKGFHTQAQCVQYFTMTTAISGGSIVAHAVPHSDVVRGGTATVRGVDSQGTRYVVTLARQKSGVWKLTAVAAA